jgi:hypothetical protein
MQLSFINVFRLTLLNAAAEKRRCVIDVIGMAVAGYN